MRLSTRALVVISLIGASRISLAQEVGVDVPGGRSLSAQAKTRRHRPWTRCISTEQADLPILVLRRWDRYNRTVTYPTVGLCDNFSASRS